MRKVKSALELPQVKLLRQSSLFKYAGRGYSVDQVVKLIHQNQAELNRKRSSSQLNFLSHVEIAKVVVILTLLCWWFYKKCKCCIITVVEESEYTKL